MNLNVEKAMPETAEQIIKRWFGCGPDEIRKTENITNNHVFGFTAAGNRFFSEVIQKQGLAGSGKGSVCLSKPGAEKHPLCRNDHIRTGGCGISERISDRA